MKVYVITKGEYSEYHICAVSTDKEKANMLRDKYSNGDNCAYIEVFDTEKEEMVLKYEHIYMCKYHNKNHEIDVNLRLTFDYVYPQDFNVKKAKYGLYTYVLANTLEDAIKIASDKFAKYRAENMGL